MEESQELVEVDFHGACVERVTSKGIKIGAEWYPKSYCKALANYKEDQEVGIIALPLWIVEQKGLLDNAQKYAKTKAKEIVEKIIPPKEQELKISCPNCQHSIGLRFSQ